MLTVLAAILIIAIAGLPGVGAVIGYFCGGLLGALIGFLVGMLAMVLLD